MAAWRLWSAALLTAALLAVVPAPPPVLADDPDEDSPDILPAGPGREETFYACVGCHSTMLVRRQGMTRAQWEGTLAWMTERHGMPPIDEPDRTLVLDYLAAKFGPTQAGRPPSPFLTKQN
jgi:hypothetical protein